jgi:hypothetical protein
MRKKLPELNRDLVAHAIDQWIIGRNGERDRIILSMYMFDGITISEMQRRLDEMGYELSVDGIKRIIRKRKEQLFRHI